MFIHGFDPKIVLAALFITLAVTLTLTLYAITTKRDLTYGSTFLLYLHLALLVMSLTYFFKPSELGSAAIITLMVGIYAFYIVYDV